MEIAYVTSYDPHDRKQWSGLGHAIMNCLIASGSNVQALGPLSRRMNTVGRVKGKIYRILGKTFEFERDPLVCWDYALQVERKLKKRAYDLVFSPGALPISRLRCTQPIVLWADSTFDSLITDYDQYSSLCDETRRDGDRADRLAYEKCALALFASEWAANSAIHHYGVPAEKVRVVPFGANLANPPSTKEALAQAFKRSHTKCNLILIGVDWIRKGVPRAIELAGELNRRGLPTHLTIVGCQSPAGLAVPPYVTISGFIDKRSHDGEARISTLLSESHFHVLFSTAEAFGVVFAEANAHAVPNIASDTGGIPTSVVNGRGGQRFGAGSPIGDIADYVVAMMSDRCRYQELASLARKEFDERLNWAAASEVIRGLLQDLPIARKRE